MPLDTWKRDALQHYVALGRLPVPHARTTALVLAGDAEAKADGFLVGLKDAVDRRLAQPEVAHG